MFKSLILLSVIVAQSSFACYYPPTPKYKFASFIDYGFKRLPGYESAPDPFLMIKKEILPEYVQKTTDPMSEIHYRQELEKLLAQKIETISIIPGINCSSNTYESSLIFLKAAFHEGVNGEKLFDLAKARSKLLHRCGKDLASETINISSVYGDYLKFLVSFYSYNYTKSFELVNTLAEQNSSAWVKETATYLKARIKFIASQQKWNGYSDPVETVDPKLLEESQTFYQIYLKNYPSGLYVSSVKNQERRLLYFSGKQKELDEQLLKHANETLLTPSRLNVEYLNEFFKYYRGNLDTSKDHPYLIANNWMEQDSISKEDIAKLERNPLASQYSHLVLFLKARTLYLLQDYKTLASLQDVYDSQSVISVSTRILKAHALRELKEFKQADDIFAKVSSDFPQDETLHLQRLRVYLNTHDKQEVYDKDSHITSPKILTDMAMTLYTKHELELLLKRSSLNETNKIYLVKELSRRYVFERHFQKVADFYKEFPSLGLLDRVKEPVMQLALNSQNHRAMLDLAKIMYEIDFQPESDLLDQTNLESDELKEFCPECPWKLKEEKKIYSPFSYFKEVVQAYENKIKKRDEFEAEALHYLVRCSKGFDHAERCGVDPEEAHKYSKMSFRRLHSRYPNSSWAKETPYYY